jgi:hypothetical protein
MRCVPQDIRKLKKFWKEHVIDHCMWPRRDISFEIVKNSHALFSRHYCCQQDTPPSYYDGIRFLIEIPSRYNETATTFADRSPSRNNK